MVDLVRVMLMHRAYGGGDSADTEEILGQWDMAGYELSDDAS